MIIAECVSTAESTLLGAGVLGLDRDLVAAVLRLVHHSRTKRLNATRFGACKI
jgi:hypothetical protein